MFPAEIYTQRREILKTRMREGLLLFLGNSESPANFGDNCYPFRQDSSFIYYLGVDRPDLMAVLDIDEGHTIVFGDEDTLDAMVWEGPRPTLAEKCRDAGIDRTESLEGLASLLAAARAKGRNIHLLPTYRAAHALALGRLLGIGPGEIASSVSMAFVEAVVAQRSIKSAVEIESIEAALAVTAEMHALAMARVAAGRTEREVVAEMQALAYRRTGMPMAFAPIFSVHGEILHNPWYRHTLAPGQLVINDSGAQSAQYYRSDITRTIPVNGRFHGRQREIYEIVLAMQTSAIEMVAPGMAYRDVHLSVCRRLAASLKDLGLMRGDPDAAVAAGAHALFMPHGLGHMLGLDVHDMDALGEDQVGYAAGIRRSEQFGLKALRLARALETGFVLTVEPGIYFIPALMGRWREAKRFIDFINYDRLKAYRDFGGIRIEDDVLVTETGARVLGPPIPKTVAEVEAASSTL